MKGYTKKTIQAREAMEVLEKKKQKIILEKNFERQRLKKYAQYVTDKTSSRRRVSIMSFYRTDPGNKNNTFCLFCVLCFVFSHKKI